MRLPAVVIVALTCSLGCSTSERVGRPPTLAEVVRINEAMRQGRSLVVEHTPAEPVCPGVSCPPARPSVAPTSVHAVDDRTLTLNLQNSERATLALDSVSGLEVTGYGRRRGAVIGASIWFGAEAVTVGILALALRGSSVQPGAPGQPHGCDAKCGGLFVLASLEGAIVGALIGAVIGTPHHFTFAAPLTPAP